MDSLFSLSILRAPGGFFSPNFSFLSAFVVCGSGSRLGFSPGPYFGIFPKLLILGSSDLDVCFLPTHNSSSASVNEHSSSFPGCSSNTSPPGQPSAPEVSISSTSQPSTETSLVSMGSGKTGTEEVDVTDVADI